MESETRSRRRPVQERSAETVQKIHDATSRLLGAGVCVEAITTAQIAAEAQVSVGALYRFFPDKQAVVDALAVRRLEEFRIELFAALPAILAERSGPRLLSEVVDRFVAFLQAHADFATVAYGGRYISRGTRDLYSGADAGVTAVIKRFMVDALGMADTPDLGLRLRIATAAGDRLLGLAMEQADPGERDAVVGQMKIVISKYLFEA